MTTPAACPDREAPPARIAFTVEGTPKPAGSKRVFVTAPKDPSKKPRAIVTDDTGTAGTDWRIRVQYAARAVTAGPPLDGPLTVSLTFILPRPKAHYGRTGLRSAAPRYCTTRPDVDKLSRAVLDALRGVIYRDDAQVVQKIAAKVYGTQPGAAIVVEALV